MSKSPLLRAFFRGYIPGPAENENEFNQRVEIQTSTHCQFPKAKELFTQHFIFFPDWIEIRVVQSSFFSFQAAALCTEVSEATGKLLSSYIEINSLLIKLSFLRRFYPLEEILTHEWVHSARSHFNCPQFEEILAYQTSKSFFRRSIGPFFDQSTLSSSLIYLAYTLLMIPVLSFVLPENIFIWIGVLLYSSFLFLFQLKALRVFKNLRIFKNCLKNVQKQVNCRRKALSLIVAFTDEEIFQTSSSNNLEWIQENQHQSIRNRMLYELLSSFRGS